MYFRKPQRRRLSRALAVDSCTLQRIQCSRKHANTHARDVLHSRCSQWRGIQIGETVV
jgi:hypothetical protein